MVGQNVKAAAESKAFMSEKNLSDNLPLDASDTESDINSDSVSYEMDNFYEQPGDELSTDDESIQDTDEFLSEELSTDDESIQDTEESSSEEFSLDDVSIQDTEEFSLEGFSTDDESIQHMEKSPFKELSTDDESIQDTEESSSEELSTDDESIQHMEKSPFEELSTDDESIQDTEESSSEVDVVQVTDVETDSCENVIDENSEDDVLAHEEDSAEAVNIQKSELSDVTANNLFINLLPEGSSKSSQDEGEKELSSALEHKNIKFMKETDPEIFSFNHNKGCYTVKSSMQETYHELLPLLQRMRTGKLSLVDRMKFIKLQYNINLHYGANVSYYLEMKSSGSKVPHYPVQKKILFYRKLLDHLELIDSVIANQIDFGEEKVIIADEVEFNVSKTNDKCIGIETQSTSKKDDMTISPESVRSRKRKHIGTEGEEKIVSLIKKVKREINKRQVEIVQDTSSSEDELIDVENDRPTVTYQIANYKGLVLHRKKKYRNGKVHHRMTAN